MDRAMTLHLSSKGRLLKLLYASKLKRLALLCAMIVLVASASCDVDERQSGIPSKAQDAINLFTEDFNAGRFEKIYTEAAEEWRSRVTLDQSNETFRTLKERLGDIKQERTLTSGRQQQNAGAGLPANSLVLNYNTKFKRGDGTEADALETFTLIERDGRYQLAGYSVSSNLLKQ
ncbi:MAG: DUF4019 domain-containing protein [Pyrinomonadaceae bacterium]|nr:DUF4019 domain-containing protein [Pyrinomonadaceae bacterium]